MSMAIVEMIADEKDLCGEGPLWSPDAETLFWVDITGRRMHEYHSSSGRVDTWSPGVGVSALALTESGDMIGAGGDGVWLLQRDLAPRLIAREHDGEMLAINDGIVDPAGRLLVGSSFLDTSGSYPLGKLYAIGVDGRVSILDDGFHLANGMGFSVDGKTLYATDSIEGVIYSYEYDGENGTVNRKRVLVRIPREEGLADGLTVDAEGFLWSAQWFGGCLRRYDPDGRLERRLGIPAEQVSSVAFGGGDYGDVFVTTAGEWDALTFAPQGYATEGRTAGGALYRFRADVQGKPEYVCKVRAEA